MANNEVHRILVLSTRDTNRSVIIKAYIQKYLEEHGITDVTVESAGTKSTHLGTETNPLTVQTLQGLGFEIDDAHRNRWIGNVANVWEVHLIITVGMREAETAIDFVNTDTWTAILNEFGGGITNPWSNDPRRSDADGLKAYQRCAQHIADAIYDLLDGFLKNQWKKNRSK